MFRSADGLRHVAVVGAGTIGASWAAFFLARNLAVTAVEPVAMVRENLPRVISSNWDGLARAGLVSQAASSDRLRIVADVASLGQDVDFVQENVREEIGTKRATLLALDQMLPPDVVIASSTSGLSATAMALGAEHPERILVGHPMNPPHLLPLVEIVGGDRTSPRAIDAAARLYRAIGKRPIILRREIAGHVATRLTVALWREAAHLVQSGVASVEDVDAAVTEGLGLRLAVAGPHLSYHLGGGSNGLAGFFAWARGPLAEWCADLGNPTVDPALEAALVDGVEAAAHGVAVQDLAVRRDKLIAAMLRAKAAADHPIA